MIIKATFDDLNEILDLQHLAYISEAKLFNDMNIQPLTETIDELIDEYNKGLVLKMIIDNKIVGSIRAHESDNTVHIGKLMVHPDYQNRGLGTKLLLEIEKYYPNKRYELFTSTRSIKNIKLYESNGYKIFKTEKVYNDIEFVYLEKN